jgi:hypothetical protein
MVQQATLCEACGERVATMHCTNPNWRHYELCDVCAVDFNCDPKASNFVPLTEPTAADPDDGL